MPKMKTKSSAKKRFKTTASGKIKAGQAGKRPGAQTPASERKPLGSTKFTTRPEPLIRLRPRPVGIASIPSGLQSNPHKQTCNGLCRWWDVNKTHQQSGGCLHATYK